MALEILELHHYALHAGPTQEEAGKAAAFYRDVLGLAVDSRRPSMPTIPGSWHDVGGVS